MEEALFKFYGFDWLAMILTFYSILAFKEKSIKGFVFGGLACICWLAFNAVVGSIAGVMANVGFLYMHVAGFLEWRKDNN